MRHLLHYLYLTVTPVLAHTHLSQQTLALLENVSPDLDPFKGSILAPILVPRVPGTSGSATVRAHILSFFKSQLPLWSVTTQNSTAAVTGSVFGQLDEVQIPIINIIATRTPPQPSAFKTEDIVYERPRHLVLAAHYDSKYGNPPDAHEHRQNLTHGFIGAIDSAVSCALLLHTARAVDNALTRKWNSLAAAGLDLTNERGLKIVLFDGEESFGLWSDEDSLHGSRALSEYWNNEDIEDIELFTLLDLLGGPQPSIPSFFRNTHWVYQMMAGIENRLKSSNLLESENSFFADRERSMYDDKVWHGGELEDDHLPFLNRGARVLHMISVPYPDVWHTMNDDAEHVDTVSTRDWARILSGFAAEWLGLEGYM